MAQELIEGKTGTAPDGTRVIVRNGRIVPLDAPAPTGPEAAGFESLGGGWYRGPDGGSYQVGRGGAMVRRADGVTGEGSAGQALKLTEDQGKAGGFARLMADAEQSYQEALDQGFNPTGFRAGLANFTDNVPGLGSVGNFIRDDAGDRARQAELQWSDAQLKAMSGAASPEAEVARNNITFFARPGQNYGAIGERLEDARRVAFESSRRRAGPDLAGLEYPDTDPRAQPTVNDGRTVEPADSALAVAPGEYAADYVARFDRDGDNRASVEEMEAAGWTFDYGAGKWFPPGEGGGPAAAAPTPPAGPQGGVDEDAVRRQTAEGRSASGKGIFRKIDASIRGAADVLTSGLSDEIVAGLDTVLPLNGGRAGWVSGFPNAYRHNLARERGAADADARDVPVSRGLGQVAGAFVPGMGVARAAVGGTRLALAGRASVGGAAFSGAYGFGSSEGNALQRLPDAGTGAGIGALAGPVAPVAANALSRVAAPVVSGLQSINRAVARPFVNALGDAAPARLREAVAVNPLRSGVNRFADRSRQVPETMNDNALAYRSQEIEPTFADVVNDGGRGTLRALATRQTPARQAAREFADGRAAGLQDRVSTQARRTLSDDPRQPAQIREEITTRRNAQADQQFGAVRGDRVSPDREIMEALRTPAMRPAIEEAATSAANRGDMETAAALRNLAGDALDYGPDAQLTVGMADRIARSLNGRAEAFQRSGNNDAAASHFAIAERLRGGARQQVPGYDEALNAYAQDSGLAAATELGEQFMTMEADAFAAAVARLSPEEQQIARAAARRAVERQAGTQGQAPGVAQRLSNGREQAARTTALVGDAAPVQQAMGAELQALRNAQGISPAQGSPTSMNAQDAMGAAGAARDVATGNVVGLAGRAMNAIRSRGFNDAEAEALVQAAIDPAQTNQLIEMLAQRMSRREARNLARALRYQLTIGPQSGQQP